MTFRCRLTSEARPKERVPALAIPAQDILPDLRQCRIFGSWANALIRKLLSVAQRREWRPPSSPVRTWPLYSGVREVFAKCVGEEKANR